MENLKLFLVFLLISLVSAGIVKRDAEDTKKSSKLYTNAAGKVVDKNPSGVSYVVNGAQVNEPSSHIGTAQISFGQHGFYPDYIQPPKGQTYLVSVPNFDYIASYRPFLENLLFSPNPFILRPEGASWTGLDSDKIPVVWKPTDDYPLGEDGEKPYKELKKHFETLTKLGIPIGIFERILDELKKRKDQLLGKPDKVGQHKPEQH